MLSSMLGPDNNIYLDQILTYTFRLFWFIVLLWRLQPLFLYRLQQKAILAHPPTNFWNAISEHNCTIWRMYLRFVLFAFRGFGVSFLAWEEQAPKSKIDQKWKQKDEQTTKIQRSKKSMVSLFKTPHKHCNFKKQEAKNTTRKQEPTTEFKNMFWTNITPKTLLNFWEDNAFCSQAETKTTNPTKPTKRKPNKSNKTNKRNITKRKKKK